MKNFVQERKLTFMGHKDGLQSMTSVVFSALFCILSGIVLFVWPDMSARIVCMVLGAILVLMGVIYLVSFFSAPPGTFMKQIHLALTIVFVVIGVWILLKPDFVISLIPVIVGIILILHGLYDLQQAVYLGRSKYRFWWLALVFAGLTIALGGVLLWNPFEAMSVAIKVIGIFLVFDGLSDLWIFSMARRITRQIREAVAESMEESLRSEEDIID
nr:DUF308 domain-containing protein [uncultured Eisenbergiella sp.]